MRGTYFLKFFFLKFAYLASLAHFLPIFFGFAPSAYPPTPQVYDMHDLKAPTFAKKIKSWVIVEEILSVTPLADDNVLICGSSAQLRIFNGILVFLPNRNWRFPLSVSSQY